MTFIMMVVVFVVGYTAIALEHPIKVNKASSALLTGVICWTMLILGADAIFGIDINQSVADFIANAGHYPEDLKKFLLDYKPGADDTTSIVTSHYVYEELMHHLGDISSILFFLLGAMTIVEMVDAHEGFRIITDKIVTTNKVKLLWLVGLITFFLSAALDNLTTSIVMAALLKKLMKDQKDLWMFGGLVIIAANAGGAWSPIGDVTTIMLWIGGQITTVSIITQLLIPSLVCLIIPLIILTFTFKGEVKRPLGMLEREHLVDPTTPFERVFLLCLGVGSLLFVPIFKTFTHLPPYMGILLGLSVVWIATEVIHRSKEIQHRTKLTVVGVLQKVDTPSVFFFLGILTAVAALQTAGHLALTARFLNESIGNIYFINTVIGFLSSVVDNVPLVAGAMGMYEITDTVIAGIGYPVNNVFWELLAYCAGTGGSCLIIGSAAGVAIMGILKIDFIWYLKKISLLATSGYLAGIAVYYFLETII